MGRIREAVGHRLRGERLRRRIAWLAPMPPAPTDIATYSKAVLEGLERIGLTRRREIEPVWPLGAKHEARIPWYAMGVYHIGNDIELHRGVYRHAVQTPGLAVLHNIALDDFVREMVTAGDPLGHQAVREALRNRGRLRSANARTDEPLRVPWAAHLVHRARGVVVHSEFGRRYLREFGCRTPVYVVPYPVVEREADVRWARGRRSALRGSLEATGMRTLVGVFGDLNAAKLIDVACEAVRRLPDVHLVLVGRRITGYNVDAVVGASSLGDRVTLLTDVSDEDFLSWVCAADMVVDLRHPHRGELSGSLARAMQCGRPTIVSRTGTYVDVPDDLVVHVSPGRLDPGELEWAIRRLAEDPELRTRIGERAAAHMAELARSDRTAHAYAEAIEGTLALVRDPSRKALARWAGALADIGVTEEHLRQGYGMSYAMALDEFAPPAGARR